MKFVTWNMNMAHNARQSVHDRAWQYVFDHGADIAFLQECVPPGWASDRSSIVHHPALTTWGSVIVGRDRSLVPQVIADAGLLERCKDYLAVARCGLPGVGNLLLASVHARPSPLKSADCAGLDVAALKRPSVPEVWWADVAFAGLREIAQDGHFVIGGDWNEARLWDVSHGRSGGGVEFFERTESAQWCECARRFHPSEVQTLFQEGKRPYQDDHLFCDEGLAPLLRHCWVEAEAVRRDGFSDHAPLWIEMDV